MLEVRFILDCFILFWLFYCSVFYIIEIGHERQYNGISHQLDSSISIFIVSIRSLVKSLFLNLACNTAGQLPNLDASLFVSMFVNNLYITLSRVIRL